MIPLGDPKNPGGKLVKAIITIVNILTRTNRRK